MIFLNLGYFREIITNILTDTLFFNCSKTRDPDVYGDLQTNMRHNTTQATKKLEPNCPMKEKKKQKKYFA